MLLLRGVMAKVARVLSASEAANLRGTPVSEPVLQGPAAWLANPAKVLVTRAAEPPLNGKSWSKASAQLVTPPRWTKDQVHCLGTNGESWRLLDEVMLLDTRYFKSVDDALGALNSGSISCPGYCIVCSSRDYYLLYPSEKKALEVSEFMELVKSGVKHKEVLARHRNAPAVWNMLAEQTLENGRHGQRSKVTLVNGDSGNGTKPEVSEHTKALPFIPNTGPQVAPVKHEGDVKMDACHTVDSRQGRTREDAAPACDFEQRAPQSETWSEFFSSIFACLERDRGEDSPREAESHHPVRLSIASESPWNDGTLSPRQVTSEAPGGQQQQATLRTPVAQQERQASCQTPGPRHPPTPQTSDIAMAFQDILGVPTSVQACVKDGSKQQIQQPSRYMTSPNYPASAEIPASVQEQFEKPKAPAPSRNMAAPGSPDYRSILSDARQPLCHVAVPVAGGTTPASSTRTPPSRSPPSSVHVLPAVHRSASFSSVGSTQSARLPIRTPPADPFGRCHSARVQSGRTTPASVKHMAGKQVGQLCSLADLGQTAQPFGYLWTPPSSARGAIQRARSGQVVAPGSRSPSCSSIATSTAMSQSHHASLPSAPRRHLSSQQRPSPGAASPTSAIVAMATVTHMTVEEMWIDTDEFDMSCEDLRLQLLTKLGFRHDGSIEPFRDASGAGKDDVWHLSTHGSPGLVLKLVEASRTQNFVRIQEKCPDIVKELAFAFPVKILKLRGPCGSPLKDLVVMRRAQGESLAQIINAKCQRQETTVLFQMLTDFGTFLRTVHKVYNGMQHGKCRPSNVFYEETSRSFTFVDVEDFGIGTHDVEHFVGALRILVGQYGVAIASNAEEHFRTAWI